MAIPLRPDFDAAHLRAAARQSKDAGQARRLLALAAMYGGSTRTEAAKIGGVTLQIVQDWVLKFNTRDFSGLIDRKLPGQPSLLDDTHRAALLTVIASVPIPAIRRVLRWRIIDLCQWMWEAFRISIARQTMSRELRTPGYRKLSARPSHHAQEVGAIEPLKLFVLCSERSLMRKGYRCRRHRNLVPRRSQGRPEEQDHSPLGEAVLWSCLTTGLKSRVFTSYNNIVDHCYETWNKLVDQPWKIMSIGLCDWAHRF